MKNEEDEDYITEIKATPNEDKYAKFLELRRDNKTNMAFFIDMAMHFYDSGMREYVDEMLLEAAEMSNSDYSSLQAIAFTYEYMHNYKKAIEIYNDLAKTYWYQLNLQQNIAWDYYEDGRPDSAIQVLYRAITADDYYSRYYNNINQKAMMLADMNMIITLHPGEVDTRFIPKEIIKPVSAELRVLVESNDNNLYNIYAMNGKEEKISNQAVQNNMQMIFSGYNTGTAELTVQEMSGKTIRLYDQHYDYWYSRQVPHIVRIRSIYNFGQPGQRIKTEVVSLKNQFGHIEIADYRQKDVGKR